MNRLGNRDRGHLLLLAALAVFIWTRDLRWVSSAADALPVLFAIPLFIWLGGPWRWREADWQVEPGFVGAAAAGFLLGAALNLTWILGLGWTVLAWGWLRERVEGPLRERAFRLSPLLFLALPWVSLDGEAIGWAFRMSGAWFTERFFATAGLSVERAGTILSIQGVPISVEAACAGLNTLQSMLIAGVALAHIVLGRGGLYWPNVALLLPLAWLANSVRIILLSGAAVTISTDFASGPFHDLSGWLVIITMFLICWGVMTLEERWIPRTRTS